MSGAIIKAKLDVKGQMGLRTQHVRGQAASAKACAERAWTAKYAFGQHTRSNDVGRGMSSSPLGSTHAVSYTHLDVYKRQEYYNRQPSPSRTVRGSCGGKRAALLTQTTLGNGYLGSRIDDERLSLIHI